METMTPKEKALDLMDRFYPYSLVTDMLSNVLEGHSKTKAKELSQIAIDEICEAINWHEFEVPNEEFNYWNRVKLEIQRL